jgi:hypothetical protein
MGKMEWRIYLFLVVNKVWINYDIEEYFRGVISI